MTTAVQEDRVGQRGTHLGALGPEERPAGLCREVQKEVALCCHPEETAELTSPYDSVHDQPGWIQLLGEVQGPPGRVLIRNGFCQEVHVRLQPLLVPCGENREGWPQEHQLQGSGVMGGGAGSRPRTSHSCSLRSPVLAEVGESLYPQQGSLHSQLFFLLSMRKAPVSSPSEAQSSGPELRPKRVHDLKCPSLPLAR